jgi:hypothetical protein
VPPPRFNRVRYNEYILVPQIGISKGHENGSDCGLHPLFVEEDRLCVKDNLLCVKDDLLCVKDDLLCVKDDLLRVKDDLLRVKDDLLRVKDVSVNSSTQVDYCGFTFQGNS